MYKELDVVILKSGKQVTILEIYDDGHFLAEEVALDGTGELCEISLQDIKCKV